MTNFKVGDKVKWNGGAITSGNGSISNGLNYFISSVNNSTSALKSRGGTYGIKNEQGNLVGSVYGNEIKLAEETKESLTTIINESKLRISEAETKLQFMEDTGSDVYDENTFKAFNVLKLVDDKKLSNIEKAKLIAELIK